MCCVFGGVRVRQGTCPSSHRGVRCQTKFVVFIWFSLVHSVYMLIASVLFSGSYNYSDAGHQWSSFSDHHKTMHGFRSL